MRSVGQLVEFVVIAAVASVGTAAIIAWGLDVLGLFPFSVLATIIAVNNFLLAVLLGPPLLYVLYPRVKRDGLLYPYLMRPEDLPSVNESRQRVAGITIAVVSVAWLVVGIAISVLVQGVPFGATPGETVPPDPTEAGIQLYLGAFAFGLLLIASVFSGERLSDHCARRDTPQEPGTSRRGDPGTESARADTSSADEPEADDSVRT